MLTFIKSWLSIRYLNGVFAVFKLPYINTFQLQRQMPSGAQTRIRKLPWEGCPPESSRIGYNVLAVEMPGKSQQKIVIVNV
jgi:hypothetical protein